MDCLLSDRGAEDMTLALIRIDFALLCRKTTADCLRNDCIVVRKLTALCQQIVSTFFLTALHFLERRIGSCAENIRKLRLRLDGKPAVVKSARGTANATNVGGRYRRSEKLPNGIKY